MQRAVVAIGIRRTGGLPELEAAQQGATDFAQWARHEQRIPASRVKLITDAKGAVGRDQIFEAVEKITRLGFIEQLIVYFSGHGLNAGLYEKWLLSRAPEDPVAAVDMLASHMLARLCGIGHVVFISDACRTAAAGIQAQSVTGGAIFPNMGVLGAENPVDQYFAALVGNPAFEVKTVQEAVARYRAAYSGVLMDALRGKVPALVEEVDGRRVVRPRRLKTHLSVAVPAYLHTLNLGSEVMQRPEARIESDDGAWLSELPVAVVTGTGNQVVAAKRAGVVRRGGSRMSGDEVLPPPRFATDQPDDRDPAVRSRRLLLAGLGRTVPALRRGGLARAGAPDVQDAALERAVEWSLTPFGPVPGEIGSGIRLRGARVAEAVAPRAELGVTASRDAVRVRLPEGVRGATVLLRLNDGSAVVVPVLRDWVMGLSFDTLGNWHDMACEPVQSSAGFEAWRAAAPERDRLRAAVAAASSLGVLRLDDEAQGQSLLERMRSLTVVDPAMAVYVAWALHDRRLRAQAQALQRWVDGLLGLRLFDLALLAFALATKPSDAAPRELFPSLPLFTQGWALLAPLGASLPEPIMALRAHLRPSLWTHFEPAAWPRLLRALNQASPTP